MSKSNLYLSLTFVAILLLTACKSTTDREEACRYVEPEEVFDCMQGPHRDISERAKKEHKELSDMK
jgi:outer membrane biogenesis lipoprotein LolB